MYLQVSATTGCQPVTIKTWTKYTTELLHEYHDVIYVLHDQVIKLVTRSGTSGKRALEIPKEAQSAGVPEICLQQIAINK